jgi:hypothetical protein
MAIIDCTNKATQIRTVSEFKKAHRLLNFQPSLWSDLLLSSSRPLWFLYFMLVTLVKISPRELVLATVPYLDFALKRVLHFQSELEAVYVSFVMVCWTCTYFLGLLIFPYYLISSPYVTSP